MTLIDEFRMLADDLYSVEGHNRYASALSKAADEIERLQSVIAGLRADFETAHARMMTSAERERDACASICDELESFWSAEKDVALLNGDVALSNATSGEPRAARAIAQAIRARGEK